jgi:N-acetylmuramoyl-L-alanine amidase
MLGQTVQLEKATVKFLIVHGTMTKRYEVITLSALERQAKEAGFTGLGFHYVIERDGQVNTPVEILKAGTHTPRFDTNSIGILMVGGKGAKKPLDNYTAIQKEKLKDLLKELTTLFPNAAPIGVGELVGGVNPSFNVLEFYNNG